MSQILHYVEAVDDTAFQCCVRCGIALNVRAHLRRPANLILIHPDYREWPRGWVAGPIVDTGKELISANLYPNFELLPPCQS